MIWHRNAHKRVNISGRLLVVKTTHSAVLISLLSLILSMGLEMVPRLAMRDFTYTLTAHTVSAKYPTSQPQRLAVSAWHVAILWSPAPAKAIISRLTECLI